MGAGKYLKIDGVLRRYRHGGADELRRGHIVAERGEIAQPHHFIAREEEQLVADDASAQRAAELVEGGPGLGGQELVAGIVGSHAVELEEAAVKLVGAALRDDVHIAGHAAGHRSRRNALGGADLLDGVLADDVDDVETLVEAERRQFRVGRGVGAVHRDVEAGGRESVDRESLVAGLGNAVVQFEQVGPVLTGDRQLGYVALAERAMLVGTGEIDERRLAQNRDLLARGSHLQLDVEAQRVAGR